MKKKEKTTNILFCGTGGQGVLAAAEICGWAAIFEGFHAKKSEVHGMAQRGGSVESHVRFGKEVFSPLIPEGEADFLVPFYKDEAERLKKMLSPEGTDFTPELLAAQKKLENKRYLNIYLLGRLARDLDITDENWIKAIEKVFMHKNFEENKRIFLEAKNA